MAKDFTFRTATITNADGADVVVHDVDYSARCVADTQVLFRNLQDKLIEQIDEATAVFGCVAWLTNRPILDALTKKRAVGIVVQKEDFLRPDSGGWKLNKQHEAYARLPGFDRYSLHQTASYDYATDSSSPSIRCVGAHNLGKSSAFPRMHNKFLVFCKNAESTDGAGPWYDPYAVWTGSFNLTYNATNSLENAVLIRDSIIAKAFLDEFGLIFGLSEPVNWKSSWSAPEHRIGS